MNLFWLGLTIWIAVAIVGAVLGCIYIKRRKAYGSDQ